VERIWKERFDSVQRGGLPDARPDVTEAIRRHWTAPTLIPHEVVFVSVCSFTFRFDTQEQLERVLQYYEQRIVPTSRLPESALGGADHWEVQRWFEKLPFFLREEPKRLKVVKALRDALKTFED